MIPSNNIFNIYYEIGKTLPFEVQRFPKGVTEWYKNQSVLVTEIHPRGQYGTARGFYLQKGERADSYWCSKDATEPQPIPCCGCGGWSLVKVIGGQTVEAEDKKPVRILEPEDLMTFGKYKGRKAIDVFFENEQYLQWAEANVKGILVNWDAMLKARREILNSTEH